MDKVQLIYLEKMKVKTLFIIPLFLILFYLLKPDKSNFTTWNQDDNTTHYIDNSTGITVTTFKKDKLGITLPNFRGVTKNDLPFNNNSNKPWRIEYFCEPDWTVSFFNLKTKKSSEVYLNELNFENQVIISNESIELSYYYKPPKESITKNRFYEFELNLKIILNYRSNKIDASIMLHPINEDKYEVTFVAQDAAYMWFPYQNQENVRGFTINDNVVSDELSFIHVNSDNSYFGTYCNVNSVFSGFETVNFNNIDEYKIYGGILNGYLFVPEYIPVGYQITSKRYGNRIDDIIENYNPLSLTHHNNVPPLISRFIFFTKHHVNYDKKFKIKFRLFMGKSHHPLSNNKNILDAISFLE